MVVVAAGTLEVAAGFARVRQGAGASRMVGAAAAGREMAAVGVSAVAAVTVEAVAMEETSAARPEGD